jgi:inner membrane protein
VDNVTHALAGMLVAEAVCVARRETRPPVRAAAYLVSALANNLPDIDIVYTWVTGPRPLGSLLHHRGHTHTLVVALLGAWLLGHVAWRWFSKRNPDARAPERRLLLGLSLAGVLLHLGMDFGNNYGVHPFWPLSSKWFYGDSIFIVEPLWWAITIPIIANRLRRRWLKLTLWALLGLVVVACWYVPFVATGSRYALLLLVACSFAAATFGSERIQAWLALGACASVAAVFVVGSVLAKAELRRATEAAFPALTVIDMVMTPMPTNPTCWEALVAGEQGDSYRVVRASVAILSLGPSACSAGVDISPTAPVDRLERPTRGGVRFRNEYRAPIAELRQLRSDDCRFRALLQFARLPYVTPVRRASGYGAAGRYAGDLRYDREPAADFSDVHLPEDPRTGPCPRFVPGWTEPRAELFQP